MVDRLRDPQKQRKGSLFLLFFHTKFLQISKNIDTFNANIGQKTPYRSVQLLKNDMDRFPEKKIILNRIDIAFENQLQINFHSKIPPREQLILKWNLL